MSCPAGAILKVLLLEPRQQDFAIGETLAIVRRRRRSTSACFILIFFSSLRLRLCVTLEQVRGAA
jgi:hypothetical protein